MKIHRPPLFPLVGYFDVRKNIGCGSDVRTDKNDERVGIGHSNLHFGNNA